MKKTFKIVAVGLAATLIVAFAPRGAYAEHNESWNNTGAIVAGIATVGIIAAIASSHNGSYSVSYHGSSYPPPPPPRCEPPPPPRQVWYSGHYETQRNQVCIPGYWNVVQVPAEYGWVCTPRGWRYVEVKPACTQRVWVPERYEWQETRVWIPGRYEKYDKHDKGGPRFVRAY